MEQFTQRDHIKYSSRKSIRKTTEKITYSIGFLQ